MLGATIVLDASIPEAGAGPWAEVKAKAKAAIPAVRRRGLLQTLSAACLPRD